LRPGAQRTYLAVDLGAESGRVITGAFDGKAVRLAELHRFANGPVYVAGTLRWDVLRLWSEIQTGLSKACEAAGPGVVSVGVDTWGVDYVLLGPGDEMLGQPYHYRDGRTAGVMQSSWSRVPRARIFAATGLQFMPINTLYQLIAQRHANPRLMDLAQRFLMMPDLFHWLLCGSQVVEFTNATTTQCFDATAQTWAFYLLREFELPVNAFGPTVLPGTSLGTLRASLAQRLGVPRLEVVAPATHDTGSAVAAVPTQMTGSAQWAYISSGTWSLMGLELPQPVLASRALDLNVTNEGGIDGTWRLLKNIMGLWLVQECRRSFERRGQAADYDALTRLAADAPPMAALVDPDAPEFLAPDDMPAAMAAWCQARGLPAPQDAGQFVRCALESLALKYRVVLEWLEELSGGRVEVIHVVGGGSRNRLLNQFTANACGRPVLAGPVEATALGNVLVQARAAGDIGSLAQMREVVRHSTEVALYEPADRDLWNQARARFQELLGRPAGA